MCLVHRANNPLPIKYFNKNIAAGPGSAAALCAFYSGALLTNTVGIVEHGESQGARVTDRHGIQHASRSAIIKHGMALGGGLSTQRFHHAGSSRKLP